MKYLLPTGIGDSVWALHKIQAIHQKLDPSGKLEVYLACGQKSVLESRALYFVRRFPFVDSAEMFACGGLGRQPFVKPNGRYNYLEDGMYEFEGNQYCVLVPNATLEQGERLEDWLPHYQIDWSIFSQFQISKEERDTAVEFHKELGDYAVFYPGPLMGNTINGHNRNSLWTPDNWRELAKRVHAELQLPVVYVGAPYDVSYYEQELFPIYGFNLIGKTSLGQLWSITSLAKFVVSYQAGVGIISTYLGTPTAIFWRPEGDSISPDFYLSFSEKMASAWVPPAIIESGTHLPLIYGKHGVDYIMEEVRRRGWT